MQVVGVVWFGEKEKKKNSLVSCVHQKVSMMTRSDFSLKTAHELFTVYISTCLFDLATTVHAGTNLTKKKEKKEEETNETF